MPDLSNERIFPGKIRVKAVFKPGMRWRLVEEFGPACFTVREDGNLLFQCEYTNRENMIQWFLTFGDQVRVLEPEAVRRELLEIAERVVEIYKEDR